MNQRYSIDNDEHFSKIEKLIQNDDMSEAKGALKQWLYNSPSLPNDNGSIAEALSSIMQTGTASKSLPALLMRCLAAPGVLPEPNAKNQMERLVVEVCQKFAPDICEFVGVRPRDQNFQKFDTLSKAHAVVTDLLSPLTEPYGDLHAIVAAKKNVLGTLNHSIVRAYCGPYRLQELKSATEVLFTQLQKVESLGPSFLQSYQDCTRTIEELRFALQESPTYLSSGYFVPLLRTTEDKLRQFLSDVKSEYQAAITKGWSHGTLTKRYPLLEIEREFKLVLPFRNEGSGLALDVDVLIVHSDDKVVISSSTSRLGTVNPGEFSVVLDAMVVNKCSSISIMAEVKWGEIGNPERLKADFEVVAHAQNPNVDWGSLEYSSPYSTAVAYGESFIGRSDLVRSCATKLLRAVMEPFYITGQKRVGKTSLAAAVTKFAETHHPSKAMSSHYILWGDVAHAKPEASLRALGMNIERFILGELETGQYFEKGTYDGSLSHLVALSEYAAKVSPEQRFVLTIDEFDEIPQELFLTGNLAETFFANLRSLSRRSNICLILVGGENMPFIMERQGQKLNNFARVNLSYFSREKEWADFQQMIRQPTSGSINWHEDAIAEVFNVSNGNPYFSKIVCASVLETSIAERDTDITADEVKLATEIAISSLGSNSFAHLWHDGIPRPLEEREPEVLRRSRVLIAAARCQRGNLPLTPANVQASRASTLNEIEVVAVLNDFVKRGVLVDREGSYQFILPIFSRWLADTGVQQLISDNLSEELANSVIAEENAALIKSEEVAALAKGWPTYRGRQIGTDDIKSWYQQAGTIKDQRALFTLLQRTKIMSEAFVRERLRAAFEILRPSLPVPIFRSRNERRSDVVITYVDGEGKSGSSYATMFADENRINATNIIGQNNFSDKYVERCKELGRPSVIVIIDDLSATGESLVRNITDLLEKHGDTIGETKIRVITIVSTAEAQSFILNKFEKIRDFNLDFNTCEILSPTHYALPEDKSGFSSEDEWERSKALCIDIGSRIDKRRPLGFGSMGLLLVFPTNVPNNTLPLLRSHSKSGSGKSWSPLFERVTH